LTKQLTCFFFPVVSGGLNKGVDCPQSSPHIIPPDQQSYHSYHSSSKIPYTSATFFYHQGGPHLFSFHCGLDLQTRWFPHLSGLQNLSQKHSQSRDMHSRKWDL